jgi:hypothetical protein
MLVASTSVLASTALLLPLALRERHHRGLARLRIAVRGACDFSWISRLAKDQQPPPQALAMPIMARPPARPCCQSPTWQSPSAIKLLPLRIGYYPAREDVVADNSVAA